MLIIINKSVDILRITRKDTSLPSHHLLLACDEIFRDCQLWTLHSSLTVDSQSKMFQHLHKISKHALQFPLPYCLCSLTAFMMSDSQGYNN